MPFMSDTCVLCSMYSTYGLTDDVTDYIIIMYIYIYMYLLHS